jgi:hypothetical protein
VPPVWGVRVVHRQGALEHLVLLPRPMIRRRWGGAPGRVGRHGSGLFGTRTTTTGRGPGRSFRRFVRRSGRWCNRRRERRFWNGCDGNSRVVRVEFIGSVGLGIWGQVASICFQLAKDRALVAGAAHVGKGEVNDNHLRSNGLYVIFWLSSLSL